MKTTLKEVLHFYLGSQFQFEATKDDSQYELTADRLAIISEDNDFNKIKLILRPLPSMTKLEAIEFIKSRGYKECFHVKVLKNGIEFHTGITTTFLQFKINFPVTLLFLIKQGFDVFDLIESGQAIDKTNQ